MYPNTYGDGNNRAFMRTSINSNTAPTLNKVQSGDWSSQHLVTSEMLWKSGSYSIITYEDASWSYNIGANANIEVTHSFPQLSGYSILFVHVKSTGSNNVVCWGTSWSGSGSTYTVKLVNYTPTAQSNKTLMVQIIYVRNAL